MKKRHLIPLLLVAVTGFVSVAGAQTAAIKSNLLSDALLNVNIGTDIGLAPKWTIGATGQFNGWELSHNRSWKHWAVQPELRYWFCDRFGGHFVGVHTHGGQFNVGGIDNGINLLGTHFSRLSDTRYQGWFVGAGLTYGYAWVLDKRWNLEAEIGVGYSYTHYDRFRCAGCGRKIETGNTHHYVGPTKAAVNLVYLF